MNTFALRHKNSLFKSINYFFVLLCITILSACGSNNDSSTITPSTPTAAVPVSIAIQGPSESNVGFMTKFTLNVTYSDGTTAQASASSGSFPVWSSSNTNVLTFLTGNGSVSYGLASLLTSGNVTVSATYQGLSASTQVIVDPPMMTSISINFPALLIYNPSGQLTASANYSDGSSQLISNPVWTSSNNNILDLTSSGAYQIVTGSTGNTQVTATYNGITGAALFTMPGSSYAEITGNQVPSISKTGGSTSYTDGSTSNACDFTTSNPAVLTLTNEGTIHPDWVATLLTPGTATITDCYGATIIVTVTP